MDRSAHFQPLREEWQPKPGTPTTVVRLPNIYAMDYHDRIGFGEYGAARCLKANKRYVYMEVDTDTYKDMLSDCDWYIDEWGCPKDQDYMMFIRSARIAFKALKEAGPPQQ